MDNSSLKDSKAFNFLLFVLMVATIIFCIWLTLKCQPHYIEIGDGTGLEQVDDN